MSETPPPPTNPPPPIDESPIQSPRTVTFQLSSSSSQFFDEFAITQESFRQETEGFKSGVDDEIVISPPTFSTSCQFRFLDSPGISLIKEEEEEEEQEVEENFTEGGDRESSIWKEKEQEEKRKMIIEEVVSSAAAAKIASSSNSNANSLDSLSECGQAHSANSTGQQQQQQQSSNTNDRSQSLGDLLIATQQQLDESNRNGSFDTLMSKGLTDSGIGGSTFPKDENLSPPQQSVLMDYISSPDSFSNISFSSFDPTSFSNEPMKTIEQNNAENANPLDGGNRTSYYDDRKHPELPAISEESEHESSHYPLPLPTGAYHSASVDKDRDIIEHSYPMTHCNSAPSNTVFSSNPPASSSANKQQSYLNNNIAHRRVVSDEVTDLNRLKRSKEMENVDKIGNFEYEPRPNNNLKKKGRCKSLMFIVQGSGDELSSDDDNENHEEDEDIDGGERHGNVQDSKDNDMLILNRANESSPRRNLYEKNPSMPSSIEPPPCRLSRKVSASSTHSTPKSATDQSWKDKMPPFALVGHSMYSPQSLPTRDAVPRSPFDGGATFTSNSSSYNSPFRLLPPLQITDFTSPDGRLILSELEDELPPLSSIFRPRTPSISSTATDCMNRSPEPNNNNNNNENGSSSFVRRSLRKIMKRSSQSTGALMDIDGAQIRGVPTIATSSLKRRASAASTSFLASASAQFKPRAKSLKKQSWMCTSSTSLDDENTVYFPSHSTPTSPVPSSLGKNKKEKSGSDTFTFSNLFRKKQPPTRPNLTDIITDLDQRSTSTRNLAASASTPNGSATLASSNRRSTSTSILPMGDGFESSSFDGLPDHISRMVSPHDDASSFVNIPSSSSMESQLDRLWGKYDLFAKEEYQSWHEKYRHNTLSQKQVKKQDAIYELYLMEKRHCANIAFLLQGYRRRMLEENVISRQDMDILIPDVLEPLLIFHLNVLERITERVLQNNEVSTISDIIYEELNIDEGKHTKLCCDAYTDFGVAKEKSDLLYHHLMNKSTKFSEFFKRTYLDEPLYKHYDFRPLITKIIGRATKYSLLLETILKNEQPFSQEYDLTAKALETARRFAYRIDENLSVAHMSRKWDEIKAQIDPSTTTGLYVPDPVMQQELIRHHFDVESLNSNPDRKLVFIGEAFIKKAIAPAGGGSSTSSSSNSGKSDKNPGYLVLFDDIIVLLQRKGTRLYFAPEQGALPVKMLFTRTSARGHAIMLISGGKPILFEINFNTSSDRKKWVAYLEAAPKNVPVEGVRLSQTNEEEMLRKRAVRQEESENQWLDKLDALFKSRYSEEESLSRYLETRLEFFDAVRAHMSNIPFKTRHDISDRIREAVRGNFKELKRSRIIPLNRLVDMMSESRDSDLHSFFDEKADAADVPDKSTDLSDSYDSSSGGESSIGRTKPRRIQTFHGTSQPGAPSSSSAPDKNGIRRHTTVPRMNSNSNENSTDRSQVDEEQEIEGSRARGESQVERKQYEEMITKLPLRQSLKARRASTRLIKEVISLRKEVHLLRSDNALTKSRCALLERSRGCGTSLTSSTASAVDESMEMLRKKEKEIRELRKQLIADKEELAEKQKAIEAQELEMQTKWNALQLRAEPPAPQHVRSGSAHSAVSSPTTSTGSFNRSTHLPLLSTTPTTNSSPNHQNIEWSPVLASLATKTESKKVSTKKT